MDRLRDDRPRPDRVDVLVEIAVIVTDADLNPLDDGLDIVIATDPAKLAGMDDVVREMHTIVRPCSTRSRATTTTSSRPRTRCSTYVKRHVPERRKAPLCGNTIATDRSFLVRYMPRLDDHLHYRMIDVSTIKELARRWYPRAYYNAPSKSGGHRALRGHPGEHQRAPLLPRDRPGPATRTGHRRLTGGGGRADGSSPGAGETRLTHR